MTESPENLATYRLILLSHAGDETIEERVRACTRSSSIHDTHHMIPSSVPLSELSTRHCTGLGKFT